MRHILKLFLRIVNGSDNGRGKLLQQIGKTVLFWSSFASPCATLRLGSDATIRIKATEGAVTLVEDTRGFFNERLNVVDELFLIKLILWRAICGLNILVT
jgi:hypothetical protein